MTLALALYLFQNDCGLRGNNGLSGLQNLPGLTGVGRTLSLVWFFWASAAGAWAWLSGPGLDRVGQVRFGHPRHPR